MSLVTLFKSSLLSAKKLAAFRLVPMGKTMQYIFLFILLFSLLAFSQFVLGIGETTKQFDGLVDYFNEISWLLYPFAFVLLFVVQTLLIFARISILSGIALLVAPLLKRRAEYRFLWRTTLFANTWSFLLLLAAYPFLPENLYVQWFSYALTLGFVFAALKYYPKLAKKA
ncbi:DUF1189 family protein [Tetzosporium hominis]|nr:DUF1189 family protein [Tetzosporium hominis]